MWNSSLLRFLHVQANMALILIQVHVPFAASYKSKKAAACIVLTYLECSLTGKRCASVVLLWRSAVE